MKLFSYFFFIFFLYSCATLNQRDSVLLVDSHERGNKVRIHSGEEQKTVLTPAIVEIGPQRNFQVQWEDKQNQKYSCEWNWGRSIIPNTIPIFFGPVGFGLSAIFHSVDLYNGRFYNCDQLVHRENLKKLRSKKLKAFLITPRHRDSKISKKIMEVFYKRTNKEKLKIVSIDQSFDRLSDFGINNLKTPSLKEIPLRRLRKYALEVGVEHAVLFNIEQVEKKLVIQPIIIDLVSEGMIDTKSYGFDDKNISNQIWENIVDVVNFIPNSLTASYFTNPRIKKIKEDETSFRTKNHPDQFPKFVSAIGMTSVIHPQNFETWDYSFQSFPSVGGSSWQRTEAGQWVNISNYHLFYNAEVSGHFALGALNIGVGYGLGTFKVEDSLGYEERKYRTMVRLGISYVAFINQKTFVRIGADEYTINGGVGKNDFSLTRKYYESYFGIGFYYPNLRYLVRSLL